MDLRRLRPRRPPRRPAAAPVGPRPRRTRGRTAPRRPSWSAVPRRGGSRSTAQEQADRRPGPALPGVALPHHRLDPPPLRQLRDAPRRRPGHRRRRHRGAGRGVGDRQDHRRPPPRPQPGLRQRRDRHGRARPHACGPTPSRSRSSTDPTMPTGKHEESPDDLGLRRAAPDPAAVGGRRARTTRRRARAGPRADRPRRGDEPRAPAVLGPAQPRPPLDRLARVLAIGARAVPARPTATSRTASTSSPTSPTSAARPRDRSTSRGRGSTGTTTRPGDHLSPTTSGRRPWWPAPSFGDAVMSDGVVLAPARLGADHPPRPAASIGSPPTEPSRVSDLVAVAETSSAHTPTDRSSRHRADDDRTTKVLHVV